MGKEIQSKKKEYVEIEEYISKVQSPRHLSTVPDGT